jgi:hypothetical protein
MGADQAIDGSGGAITEQIATGAGNVGFKMGGQQARLGFNPFQDPRNDGLGDIAIAEPADCGHGDRHQQDHRDGEPRSEGHGEICTAS